MKHLKLFEAFLDEAKYIKLNSVGSVMDQDGVTYPMLNNGQPDLDSPVELADIDMEDDWYQSLNNKDRSEVDRMMKKLGLNEAKDLGAMIDVLTNSMEHYDEDTFMDASDEFGYDAETMKEIFNDYWSIDAKKRMGFDDSDWKKWLKSYK